MPDEVDVMPETLKGSEKKDAAIQCNIGLRWFDLSRKTVASVGKNDISKSAGKVLRILFTAQDGSATRTCLPR